MLFQAKNGNYTDEEIEQIQTITSKISSICDGVTVDKVLTAFAALVSATIVTATKADRELQTSMYMMFGLSLIKNIDEVMDQLESDETVH